MYHSVGFHGLLGSVRGIFWGEAYQFLLTREKEMRSESANKKTSCRTHPLESNNMDIDTNYSSEKVEQTGNRISYPNNDHRSR